MFVLLHLDVALQLLTRLGLAHSDACPLRAFPQACLQGTPIQGITLCSHRCGRVPSTGSPVVHARNVAEQTALCPGLPASYHAMGSSLLILPLGLYCT